MASVTAGWRWPILHTLMPAMRSINDFPFASHNVEPSALTISSANGASEVCAICCKKSCRWFNVKIYMITDIERVLRTCKCRHWSADQHREYGLFLFENSWPAYLRPLHNSFECFALKYNRKGNTKFSPRPHRWKEAKFTIVQQQYEAMQCGIYISLQPAFELFA